MKKKISLISLFLVGKFLEFIPFFFEKIVNDFFYYLSNFLKISSYHQELYAFAISEMFNQILYIPFLILPIFSVPILIGLIAKRKKIVGIYVAFSTLADFSLLLIFFKFFEQKLCNLLGWMPLNRRGANTDEVVVEIVYVLCFGYFS